MTYTVLSISGYYAVNTTDNVPCFVYATFNNRIYIYYNIRLPRVESTNSIEVMDKCEETHELLKRLNIQCELFINTVEVLALKSMYMLASFGSSLLTCVVYLSQHPLSLHPYHLLNPSVYFSFVLYKC